MCCKGGKVSVPFYPEPPHHPTFVFLVTLQWTKISMRTLSLIKTFTGWLFGSGKNLFGNATIYKNQGHIPSHWHPAAKRRCINKIPYRTKLFIGINVRKIRDCQKSRKVKPTNIYSLRSYMLDNNTGAVCYYNNNDHQITRPPTSPTLYYWAIEPAASLPKNTRVVRETLSPWISREDNTIANFSEL